MNTRWRLAGIVAAALPTISDAHAGAFAIRQQSAYSLGSAFAGMAAGGSLSSMFANPATLSDLEENQVEAGAMGVLVDTNVKLEPAPLIGFSGSDEGDIGQNAVVPFGYAAYRLNDAVVFGVGINAPFGLSTEYADDSILSQSGVAGKSEILTVNLNPAVSVEVTDWLALALGVQVQYFDGKLTQQTLGPLGLSSVEGDDVGVGFTAGFKVTPVPGTEIGLGYRSFIDHEVDGELNTANAGTFDVQASGIDLPDIVTFGIRQLITDHARIMVGIEWSNWSRWKALAIEGGPAPIELPFDYDDSWNFAIGGEFDVTEQVSMRSGFGYEVSPIDDNVRSYRLPGNDGIILSAGASYWHDERFSLDVGYGFVIVEDMDLHSAGEGGPQANGPFSGHADTYVHYISAAINVKF